MSGKSRGRDSSSNVSGYTYNPSALRSLACLTAKAKATSETPNRFEALRDEEAEAEEEVKPKKKEAKK